MKKMLSLLVVLTVVLLGVIPATAQEGPAAPELDWTALPVEEGATLTVSGWGDQTEQQVVLDSIERFNAVFPDVTVNFEPIPNDFQTVMKANMAAGTAADVFYVDADLMTAFGRTGQLLALDEYMDMIGLSRDAYVPALINMFTFEDVTYALPKDMGSLGLVYIPHFFDEAGIDYPTADWTWDDMVEAARTITEETGTPGMCVPPDVGRWPAAVYQAGGKSSTRISPKPCSTAPKRSRRSTFGTACTMSRLARGRPTSAWAGAARPLGVRRPRWPGKAAG